MEPDVIVLSPSNSNSKISSFTPPIQHCCNTELAMRYWLLEDLQKDIKVSLHAYGYGIKFGFKLKAVVLTVM